MVCCVHERAGRLENALVKIHIARRCLEERGRGYRGWVQRRRCVLVLCVALSEPDNGLWICSGSACDAPSASHVHQRAHERGMQGGLSGHGARHHDGSLRPSGIVFCGGRRRARRGGVYGAPSFAGVFISQETSHL